MTEVDNHLLAQKVLPGGAGRTGLFVGGRIPPAAVRGVGCRLLDETGRWIIDAHNNFTVLIHGHGYAPAVNAVVSLAESGSFCFGVPHNTEYQLAATIADRIESVEQVRFTNSGTEAVQTAMRLARASTGRSTMIGVGGAYHGSGDAALAISGGYQKAGIPAEVSALSRPVPFNDVDALEAAAAEAGDDLAMIIVDLMANYTGLRQLSEEYLRAARRLCDTTGAMLAFDEVVSLRHHVGGLQAAVSVRPDLTTMGKIIGGGLPVGAIGGNTRAMALLDPTRPGAIYSSGTFTGNPLTMAAGLATLEGLDSAAIERINSLGARLRESLGARLPEGWGVRGYGSLARVLRADGSAAPSAFFWKALDHGLLVTPAALVVISTAMDDGVIDEIIEKLVAAAREVTDAENAIS